MSIGSKLSGKSLKYKEIYRSSILDRYCHVQGSKNEITSKYFSQLWQGYAWVAIIGFINNRRSKLGDKTDSAFKFSVINNSGGEIADALILMAVAKSDKGYKALIDPEEIIKVIEEYANGGFEIIEDILREDNGYFDNPDAFVDELLDRDVDD